MSRLYGWLSSARGYAAFGLAIPGYVRRRLSIEEARLEIKTRLATREERFLRMVSDCIFSHPASPYLPLLRSAGAEFGDIKSMVMSDGLEPTLSRLRSEGVYFTFEEFKGREPVKRPGVSFPIGSDDFDNPRALRHFSTRSGGTTGSRTRSWMSLDYMQEDLPNALLVDAAQGLLGVPTAVWWPGGPMSFAIQLSRAQFTDMYDKWFVPRGQRKRANAFKYGLARRLISLAARAGGVRLPKLEWVDPDDGLLAARWAERTLRSNDRCLITTGLSQAVRIATAAYESGIDLHGATFKGAGEPSTSGKVRAVNQTGAKWISGYAFSEGGGRAGAACVNPADQTDVHFLSDRRALIQYPRKVPGSDLVVDAFNFTMLSPGAPKVLLNVETDDFGVIETRSCGCPLEELGYKTHLRDIYSFSKLTGEGVTLVGSEMIRILEEVLPSRFGGGPLDYQLIEEEGEQSLTRLSLVIHPRVKIEDESQVISAVLKELSKRDGAASMAGTIWAQSGTFRIRRMEPIGTARGKLMPLHLSKRKP